MWPRLRHLLVARSRAKKGPYMSEQPPEPELQALLDALERATDPQERQRAWNALVAYQRAREPRARPDEHANGA
jgi:hypothetical protein